MSKCKTVTLRKRKIKNGTQYSLCLDYYQEALYIPVPQLF